MRKIIKITEAQLREAEADAFTYLDKGDDAKPYNGQSTITAQGKIDAITNADPIYTDRIGKQRTPQSWARYRMYGNINMKPHANTNSIDGDIEHIFDFGDDEELNEGVAIDNDKGENYEKRHGVDPMSQDVASLGNGSGVETLTDEDPLNNLSAIPFEIETRTDALIKSIKQHNLSPKQIAMVLDKIQETFPEIGQNSEFVKSLLRQQIDPNSIKDHD